MTRGLAVRLAKLEAKYRADANAPRGVIGGLPETYVEEINGVLYQRRLETRTGQRFDEYARKQQGELQSELLRLFSGSAAR